MRAYRFYHITRLYSSEFVSLANSGFCFELYCSKGVKIRASAFYKTHSSIVPIWELFPFFPWHCKDLHKLNYTYLLCISISLLPCQITMHWFLSLGFLVFQKLAQKGSYLQGGKGIRATLQKKSFSHKHIFADIFRFWKTFWFFWLENEMFSLTSMDLGGFL